MFSSVSRSTNESFVIFRDFSVYPCPRVKRNSLVCASAGFCVQLLDVERHGKITFVISMRSSNVQTRSSPLLRQFRGIEAEEQPETVREVVVSIPSSLVYSLVTNESTGPSNQRASFRRI